jgi:hypothetical protein
MERRFGEESERVCLLLFEGKRFRGNVARIGEGLTLLLIHSLACSGQRLQEHRARLRRQPPADDHHAVFVLMHAECATVMTLSGFARLGDTVHTAPAADDALDVAGGAGAAHGQQTLFGFRRGHAGERPHFRVRELASREGLGQPRQRRQGARHPHAFPSRAQVESHAPAQPGGARAESRVPAAVGVEFADDRAGARSRSRCADSCRPADRVLLVNGVGVRISMTYSPSAGATPHPVSRHLGGATNDDRDAYRPFRRAAR